MDIKNTRVLFVSQAGRAAHMYRFQLKPEYFFIELIESGAKLRASVIYEIQFFCITMFVIIAQTS